MQQIINAEVLIGSRRLLSLFPDADADTYVLSNNYKLLITRIVSLSKKKKVVVLVSGDPGFFSYSKLIIDKLGIEKVRSDSGYQFCSAGICQNRQDLE